MDILFIILSVLLAFLFTWVAVPPIVNVSNIKHLYDELDERKVHVRRTPTLGGVAIFIGMTISILLSFNGFSFSQIRYLIAGIIMLLFIGLKDDILVIAVKKKLFVQLVAALIVVVLGHVRFTNLHGILGIHEIGYGISVVFSVFVIIGITNAINLIDGIDGLASGIAFIISTLFGTWFYLSGYPEYAVVSFALAGSLAAFFRYNVFGKKYKLFMGDTGSLIIGLVIAVLVIQFNEFHLIPGIYNVKAAPVISFSVVIVPVIDTVRVFAIRLANGKSPFKPDKNHVHHWLLSLTNNHLKTTSIIMVANLFLIAAAILICQLPVNINYILLMMAIIGFTVASIPWFIFQLKNRQAEDDEDDGPSMSKVRVKD